MSDLTIAEAHNVLVCMTKHGMEFNPDMAGKPALVSRDKDDSFFTAYQKIATNAGYDIEVGKTEPTRTSRSSGYITGSIVKEMCRHCSDVGLQRA